tara:strand:+ start:274 stop:483 length:210 start_codon:yes stop_codon:yes gene_type:complete
MREQTDRLIDLTIVHLEQMHDANSRIPLETLVAFVQRLVWTKKPIYQNTHYIKAIAHIAWHSTDKGKAQ